MSETYGSELEARQALAKTTYDLWVDGKLKDGAEAEIAAKLKADGTAATIQQRTWRNQPRIC